MNLDRKFLFVLCCSLLVFAVATPMFGQRAPKYSYAAQSKLMPKDLGKVYIGMPLRDFAKQIDISKSYVEDDRFEELRLHIPFAKGNITSLIVQVAGFPVDGRSGAFSDAKIMRQEDDGEEYELDVKRPIVGKIPASAFVYVYSIGFKSTFDQKVYVTQLYGKGTERDPAAQHSFSDIEWVKTTSDGLKWLIRSNHDNGKRNLTLYGRVKGTEWGLDS